MPQHLTRIVSVANLPDPSVLEPGYPVIHQFLLKVVNPTRTGWTIINWGVTEHDSHDHSVALGSTVLRDISDVTEASKASGDVLRWNGSAWANYPSSNYAASGHVHALNDVSNVTVPTPTTGDVLRWNGSAWVNHADSGYAAAGHTHSQAVAVAAVASTSYTLVLGDAHRYMRFTDADAVTVTVPTNASVAYDVGTVVRLYAAGVAGLTFAGDSGVTVNGAGSLAQYKTASLIKVAANEWDAAVT